MREKKASPGLRNSPLCQREMKLKPRLAGAAVVAPLCRPQVSLVRSGAALPKAGAHSRE